MFDMLDMSYGLLGFVALVCALALLKIKSLKSLLANTQNLLYSAQLEAKEKSQSLAQIEAKLESANHFYAQALKDKSTQLDELKQSQKSELEKLEKRYENSLKTLKDELEKNLEIQKTALLNQNKVMLNKDSRELLEEIFTPLKKEMEGYSKSLIANEASLKENISHIFTYSRKLGEDANKLAQVLQGEKKVRGNFGELQLKAVLESSGLQEGVNYELQSSFSDDEGGGKRFVPDAVVYFDTKSGIVIDSKFSLPNLPSVDSTMSNVDFAQDKSNMSASVDSESGYMLSASTNGIDDINASNAILSNPANTTGTTNTTNTTTNALSSSLLQAQIAKNLKSRIDELAKKNYQRFHSSNPRFANAKMHEFVLLFVPYQNILDMALEADAYIYQYAYQKGIYLTTPHTLFMALKTISIGWVHIQSDEKVQRAFEEIGRFYDKFASFYEDFERLKKTLKQAQNTSDEMETKINGKGGLSSRVETLKELGAKTKKSLPKIKETQDKEPQDLDKLDKTKIIDNDEKWELAVDPKEIDELNNSSDMPEV